MLIHLADEVSNINISKQQKYNTQANIQLHSNCTYVTKHFLLYKKNDYL